MAWIFQGNPKIFDIDDYLARSSGLIYWRATRYRANIEIGGRVFIWRAGTKSGVIASGVVVEAPVEASAVLHPEALGDDLWTAEMPRVSEPKVGIALDSVRLSAEEGMVPRAVVKDDSLLKLNAIIRIPNNTVFRLDDAERMRVEELWVAAYESEPEVSAISAIEGKVGIRAHRWRERSRFLVKKKLEEFRRLHGSLHCELCALTTSGAYPASLATSIFEVHHTLPLASAITPRRTTLADLVVLCANCHRAIHATPDVEANMKAITRQLEK